MPSNFDNVRMSEDIESGSSGGPEFSTTILDGANGSEWSNEVWRYPRSTWNISFGVQNADEYRSILDFFKARRGKARHFRFRDWSDYKAFAQPLGVGDGATKVFQTVKVYDGPLPLTRRILCPVADTFVLYENGAATTGGFTLDDSTGVVTFAVAPAAGVVLTADFEFDLRMRFDSDSLSVKMIWEGAGSIPAINVVEVTENAD